MTMISKFDLEKIRPTCKTLKEFAEKVGLSVPTLVRQLRIYDMPTSFRRKGSGLKLDRDLAYQLYVVEKKALREIASMYNVTHQAVAQWLKIFEIDTRDMNDPNIKKKYPKNRKKRTRKPEDNQV
jgi:hypothetical protein